MCPRAPSAGPSRARLRPASPARPAATVAKWPLLPLPAAGAAQPPVGRSVSVGLTRGEGRFSALNGV